ncbi:peptidase [Streptomyces sp. CB03234]|uniref:M23 family metallopeptidase n=1 Tax=Streptomyces sp. (strain CB03234) TaxID=1703937 RepID=UPI000938BD53|nr:M23 family metallopeptidase [Streptomyces sp. CB03234]OKK02189.1 peptidase [Streptomyces sp. CB03234]
MASNRPAPAPEAPYGSIGSFNSSGVPDAAPVNGQWEEWNPTEETVRPVRGRHRVAKQRGGLARSSTVLGVGVIAAVGAGGMATAQDKPAVSISLPDVVTDNLPDAESLPGIGALMSDDSDDSDGPGQDGSAQHTNATLTGLTGASGADAGQQSSGADAGEALRARILQQAEQQQASADAEAKAAAEQAAAEQAAAEAKAQATAAEKQAAEEKAKAEAEAEAKAAAAEKAAEAAEAERLAALASSWSLPTSSYTITSTYGQAGNMWSSGYHTGLDLAAPTGTPAKAVHGGTIKSAGWSGSYGYRIVLELEDGTEVWYCHLSSMTVGAGQTVGTGETIGRVGATGNVTGPHLHLEVHTAGGDGIDPLAWLRGKGLTV